VKGKRLIELNTLGSMFPPIKRGFICKTQVSINVSLSHKSPRHW